MLYLVVAVGLGLVGAILHGRVAAAEPRLGLMFAGEAPTLVLIPAAFGIRDLDLRSPPGLALASTVVFVLMALAWARGSRRRSTILLAVFFIVGGYLITYPFRTAGGRQVLFRNARYHLYPQLGLALLAGAAARRFLSGPRAGRIVARSARACWPSTCLA